MKRRHALGYRYGGLGELYAACAEALAVLERIEKALDTHQMPLFAVESFEGMVTDSDGADGALYPARDLPVTTKDSL